jgi:hypothetical protein
MSKGSDRSPLIYGNAAEPLVFISGESSCHSAQKRYVVVEPAGIEPATSSLQS